MYRFDLTDAQWGRIAPFFPDRYHHGRAGHPWKDHRPLVNGISGTCTPAPRGPTPPSATAPGTPSTTASTAGARTAPGPESWTPSCYSWTSGASSGATCGASTAPPAAPTRPPRAGGKNPDPVPQFGGPKAAQAAEPPDHALGRSRGGFGTKTHLVCDSQGLLLAVWVTAGPRHESRGFEPVMGRARRPRRPGRRRWPDRGAG